MLIDEKKWIVLTSKTIAFIEKTVPWKPKCYNKALTAKYLLKKRNLNTNMFVGFRKVNEKMDGHAWLTYKDNIVTGKNKHLGKYKVMQ